VPDNSELTVPSFVPTTKGLLIIELRWHQNKINAKGVRSQAGEKRYPLPADQNELYRLALIRT
jgi:hypothetical protein